MSDAVWTVRKLLEWTSPFFTRKGVEPARLNAELLLAHVLQIQRIKLYMDIDRVLDAAALAAFRELVRRAGEQEPVAYLTDKAHFFNLELEVTRDVLIPRPDTEVLVEQAIRIVRSKPQWEAPRILDLCTGSGCVAAAMAANLKTAAIVAVDISPAAITVAQRNIRKLNLSERVTLMEGDLYAPLIAGGPGEQEVKPYHLILANPPYIPSAQIAALEKSVRDYEPRGALDGGADGLAVLRRIWADAAKFLSEDGMVLSEIAFDQGPAAIAAIAGHPSLSEPQIFKDYSGHDRVIAAKRK